MAKAKLSGKQDRFCAEYLLDLNATQAAIRAGYSKRTAGSQGFDLLQKPEIAARIAEMKLERSNRTEITADRVVMEIAKIAFASMRRFVTIDSEGQPVIDLSDTPDDDLDALLEVSTETVLEPKFPKDPHPEVIRKTKIKLADKLGALEKLAEHTGVYAKEDKRKATDFAQAFAEIISRGSKAPLRRDSDS
ncbi:terminase small subunit [Cereibacter changlensis]|uniref:terminase small subunit n=1 Tax=Cereibacter changlensis TaxID=402884 RepID=UPI004034B0B3